DDQGPYPVVLQMKMVDHHRRRLHLVGREDAARVARTLRQNDAEVALLLGGDRFGACGERLDAARGGAGTKASGEGHGHCTGASRAAVRSKPNAMLKHSTPWPEAPLIRLSSAEVTTALPPCAATLTRHRLE